MWQDLMDNTPDILDEDYDAGNEKTAAQKRKADEERKAKEKRKAPPLSVKSVNTTSSRESQDESSDKRSSKKAGWQVINATSNGGRVSGLSKKAKRS